MYVCILLNVCMYFFEFAYAFFLNVHTMHFLECMSACMHACMHACMYACMHVSYIDIIYIYTHIQLHTPFGFKYHEVIQDSLLRFSKIPSFNKASLTFASHWPILGIFLVGTPSIS